ncbi:MAG: hypothetical protein ABI548_23385 [Polyangiaceae bacterium]
MTGRPALPDPVSTLLTAAEALRAAVRPLELVELADTAGRQDLRDLIGGVRRAAFVAISLAAIELRAEGTGAAREPVRVGRRAVM